MKAIQSLTWISSTTAGKPYEGIDPGISSAKLDTQSNRPSLPSFYGCSFEVNLARREWCPESRWRCRCRGKWKSQISIPKAFEVTLRGMAFSDLWLSQPIPTTCVIDLSESMRGSTS